MSDRSIFNRTYTEFNAGGTVVYLVNGSSVQTSLSRTQSFTAGETLAAGDAVYVSGTLAYKASALSGVADFNYGVVGLTANGGSTGSGVAVVIDDIVSVSSSNITAESQLIPGSEYFLSKYYGQITRYTTGSGSVTNSGVNQYQALISVGKALTTTELEVEIQSPIILVD
jgi:hypothetical protein